MSRIPACFIMEQATGRTIISRTGERDDSFDKTLAELQTQHPEVGYETKTGCCDVELKNGKIQITFHSDIQI